MLLIMAGALIVTTILVLIIAAEVNDIEDDS